MAVLGGLPGEKGQSLPAYLLGLFTGGSPTASSNTNLSEPPVVLMPAALAGHAVSVTASEREAPRHAGFHYRAVGSVYDIKFSEAQAPADEHVSLGHEATLTYRYNRAALLEAGLLEDFRVFYYDKRSSAWLPLEKVEVDTETATVRVFTDHFTPFVLTALPAATGSITDPPACIAADFPAGLGGSGSAKFMTIAEGYQYYQDRPYIINTGDPSFAALGFQGALGISTCNGDSACGPHASHKYFGGTNYVQFTAHTALDVYVLYDDRKPGAEASWLAANGYAATGHNISTTDPGANYNVYKKTFAPGQAIDLHGNLNGAGAGIHTNYWAILKPAGVTTAQPPGALCVAIPGGVYPLGATNLRAAPGANVVNLRWNIPADPSFAGVIVRRSQSAAPSKVDQGVAPSGTVNDSQSFRDTGLAVGATYFYSVFAVDSMQNVSAPVSVAVTTGPDSDGDFLSDAYEAGTDYRVWFPTTIAPYFTSSSVDNSDGNGLVDGDEWLNGTDPTDGDPFPPVVTVFTGSTPAPNYNPFVPITLDGTDNAAISHWLITENNIPPPSGDPRWSVTRPTTYELTVIGSHSLYAWARDAAGNVSAAVPPLSVQFDGISVSDKLVSVARTTFDFCNLSVHDNALYLYDSSPLSGPVLLDTEPLPLMGYFVKMVGSQALTGYANWSPGIFCAGVWQDPSMRNLGLYSGSGGVLAHQQTDSLAYAEMTSLAVNPVQRFAVVALSFLYPTYQNTLRLFTIGLSGMTLQDTVSLPANCTPGGDCKIPSKVAIYNDRVYVFVNDAASNQMLIYFYRVSGNKLNYVSQTTGPGNNAVIYGKSAVVEGGRFLMIPYSSPNSMTSTFFAGFHQYRLDATGNFQSSRSIALNNTSLDANVYLNDGRLLVFGYKQFPPATGTFDIYEMNFNGDLTLLGSQNTGAWMSDVQLFASPAGREIWWSRIQSGSTASVRRYVGTGSSLALFQGDALVNSSLGQIDFSYVAQNNLPPQIRMGPERWVQFRTGQPVALSAHGYAWDPDASLCSANPSNYLIGWEIVSVPPGSGVTTASIVNPTDVAGAYFVPDIVGDYQVRLRFTDHPGSCTGVAQSASGQVKLKIGYEHKTKSWCYEDKNTEPHSASAQWFEQTLTGPPWFGEHFGKSVSKYHLYSSLYGVDPEPYKCSLWFMFHGGASCARDHGEMLYGDRQRFHENERAAGRVHAFRAVYLGHVPVSCGFWHWWDYSP